VDGIVKAVLYEGYMLYPYRPSTVKNRQRFNFGVVYPRVYSEAQRGTDPCTMQTVCLALGSEETRCVVQVRFLRMVARSVGKLLNPTSELCSEAVEEKIELTEFNLSALAAQPMQWPFRLSAKRDVEAVRDERGLIVGIIYRDKASVAAMVELIAEQVKPGLFKLTTRISNDSRIEGSGPIGREEALTRSLVSAHTILAVDGGEFVSLIDPPEILRDFARACQNVGTWPVLVGAEGQRDTMLSSPIILYDYPQIAPESPGDLFDGAEIDEILSLRIMTMTEEEKQEMRHSDARARKILERTEALPDEQFMKLHGALRGLRAVKGGMP
jgi:hydrogenase maturation protease